MTQLLSDVEMDARNIADSWRQDSAGFPAIYTRVGWRESNHGVVITIKWVNAERVTLKLDYFTLMPFSSGQALAVQVSRILRNVV